MHTPKRVAAFLITLFALQAASSALVSPIPYSPNGNGGAEAPKWDPTPPPSLPADILEPAPAEPANLATAEIGETPIEPSEPEEVEPVEPEPFPLPEPEPEPAPAPETTEPDYGVNQPGGRSPGIVLPPVTLPPPEESSAFEPPLPPLPAPAPPANGIDKRFDLEFKSYLRYYYRTDPAGSGDNAFEIDKVYLGGRYRIDDDFSFRARAQFETGGVWIKYAYLDWNPQNLPHQVLLGLHKSPYYAVSDNVWNHRPVRKVLPDDVSASQTTDLGIQYLVRFGNSFAAARVTNGEGYKNSEDDHYKAYELVLSYHSHGYGLKKPLGFGIDLMGAYNRQAGPTRDYTYSGLMSYCTEKFRLGGEYTFIDRGYHGYGWSAYGAFSLGKRVELFGRFDTFDPDETTPADEHELILGGLCFKVYEGFNTSVSYQREDNSAAGIDERIVLSFCLAW